MYEHGNLHIDTGIVEDALLGILSGDWDTENSALESARIRSCAAAGISANDRGLVIALPDGSEFQVAIIRTR